MKRRKPREILVQEPLTQTLGDEAKRILKEKRERLQTDRARRAARPLPNWKCYTMVFVVGKNIDEHGNWLGGKLPTCRVCEGRLDPQENHECPGFQPKYVEHDEEWQERWDDRVEMIRESRETVITCEGCGEETNEDNYQWHDEHCVYERDPDNWRSGHYAINGDEDDLSGYEDEPEEDYCEDDGDDGD